MSQPNHPLLASPDDIETQFYEAMQQGDIEKMMTAWSDDEDITCVHPGGRRVVGPAAIRASFEQLFANSVIAAIPERVRRIHTLTGAVHSVLERIHVETEKGPRDAFVIATNVYVKTPQGWRMVAHHASAGTASELEELADAPTTLH